MRHSRPSEARKGIHNQRSTFLTERIEEYLQDDGRGSRRSQSSLQDDECGILQLKSARQDGSANAVGCATTLEACINARHSRPSEVRKGIHNQRSTFLTERIEKILPCRIDRFY